MLFRSDKRDIEFTEKLKQVDTRYEQALARYTQQFSIVNSTIANLNSLKSSLAASFRSQSGE